MAMVGMAGSLSEVLKQMARQEAELVWVEVLERAVSQGGLPSWAVQLFLQQEGQVSVRASVQVLLLRNQTQKRGQPTGSPSLEWKTFEKVVNLFSFLSILIMREFPSFIKSKNDTNSNNS